MNERINNLKKAIEALETRELHSRTQMGEFLEELKETLEREEAIYYGMYVERRNRPVNVNESEYVRA